MYPLFKHICILKNLIPNQSKSPFMGPKDPFLKKSNCQFCAISPWPINFEVIDMLAFLQTKC